MGFSDKYTTSDKVSADKTGKEKEKVVVSNDSFLNAEMTQALIDKIEQARLSLI